MMASELQVSETEFRELVVNSLELVTPEEFEGAHSLARRFHLPLEEALAERSHVPLKFLLEQLAQRWNVQFTELGVAEIRPAALHRIAEDYARTHLVVAFKVDQESLSVAMVNPRDSRTITELSHRTGLRVVPYLAPRENIERAHLLYRGNLLDLLRRAVECGNQADTEVGQPDTETNATRLLTQILEYAALSRASDIHIEPYEHETLVRYRIDGVLHEVLAVPPAAIVPLVARIKALARMRIDDRRSPQDGRLDGEVGALKLDLRVSSLPTYWGEKIVMRVLAKQHMTIDLENLGLVDADRERVLRTISRPHGMILVTGPTGCGKSTTLYALLARLGSERKNLVNISTVEDPVEHPLPRVSQINLNPAAGIDYASGLRALLRQDPDIIMVGEIRDHETAEIAVRAALVGRLLLSTLHTNDAPTAIPRLIDMGVEPFLLASTLSMVIAQRLVRRICFSCRESIDGDDSVLDALSRGRPGFAEALKQSRSQGALFGTDHQANGFRLFRGKGCPQCNGTGYSGRVGVFEVLEIDNDIKRLILSRPDSASVRNIAARNTLKTMYQDGLAKAILGETTLDELARLIV
jgi:type IV pilus assembly protein PilB